MLQMIQHIMDWYRPGAVVLQCGADSLAGDKLGCFNLSMRGHASCVSFLQSFSVPLVCVGGGGYTVRNVARTWTYETALLLGRQPDEDLPFNDYMNWFGPEYKLDVRPTSMENLNSDAYLEELRKRVVDNLRCLPFAPSVQLQQTPRYGLNAHAEGEISDSELEEGGELEKRVQKALRRAEMQRRIDAPQSDVDSEDEEIHTGPTQDAVHGSRPLKRDLSSLSLQHRGVIPVLWSGNRALDERKRFTASLFEREGSISSSIGTASKFCLADGYAPSGLAALGHTWGAGSLSGPPEALKRILAAKLSSSNDACGSGKRSARTAGILASSTKGRPNGMSRYDFDVDMDPELDNTNDEEDEEYGSDDDGIMRTESRSHVVRHGDGSVPVTARLTKTGRPRRSFFDSAQPYHPWTSGALNAKLPLTVHSATNGHPTSGDLDSVVTMNTEVDLERERELERGRRGEGGGSQLNMPLPESMTASS